MLVTFHPNLLVETQPPVDSTDEARVDLLGVDCPVCSRLRNLYLTGEWVCPRCGGPGEPVADALRSKYVLRKQRAL